MASNRIMRPLAAIGAAAIGLMAATLLGAPLSSALLALVAGIFAFWLAAPYLNDSSEPEPTTPHHEEPLPLAQEVLDAVDEPMLIVRDRRVALANEVARRVLGDHIEGVDVRLAIRHPAAAELLTAGDGNPAQTKTDLVGLGERERRWEMTTARLADGSRLVRLSDRSEAFASEQMRGDFVANASHELRTPLATILGFLETLQDETAAEDKKTRSRFLTIMFDEARRMHRLVDDLISLSRIEAERFTLPREMVDLIPLVEEVRGTCAPMIEKSGGALAIEGGDVPRLVLGDSLQLGQLIQNLVVNAFKYGRAGSTVVVRFDETGPEMLSMSVTDEGEGVGPEHLARLTERFYRADPGRSRAVGGTGLGLAIVKHIVERHRGRLEISSTLGVGTTVRVSLPRAIEAAVTKA